MAGDSLENIHEVFKEINTLNSSKNVISGTEESPTGLEIT